jgi:hypothetical protein
VGGFVLDWGRDVQGTAGLILLANLDVDGRRLPDSVKPTPAQTLDADRPTLPRGDANAKPLSIVAAKGVNPADLMISLLLPETAENTVRINTPSGRRMLGLHRGGGVVRYPTSVGRPTALLEAARLPGSPLSSARTTEVTMEVATAAAGVVESDRGPVTVAPLILVGDLAPPRRLYMCLDEDENDPSVAEVRAACAAARVSFMPIPVEVHGGDTWVQDQFQLGFCQSPDRTMTVLLHLPRVRSGFVLGQAGPNLAELVLGHFPSAGLGVYQDFWQRKLEVKDTTGKSHWLKFADSGPLLYAITGVGTVFGMLAFQLMVLGKPFTGKQPRTFAEARQALPRAMREFRSAVTAAKGGATPTRASKLDERLKALETLVREVDKAIPLQPNGIGLPIAGALVTVDKAEADVFAKRLDVVHDSLNYGGNIVVGPGGSAGKVVIGEQPSPADPDDDQREVDPDLFGFLTAQRVQPVVKIDTGWLDVGHVDELISFVPDRYAASGAAILRAAPEVAMLILRELRTRFLNGLNPTDFAIYEPYRYSGVSDRRTMAGSFPVTHLLRGKRWLHRHAPGDASSLEPPRIYRLLADADSKQPVSGHRIDYKPGYGSDRHYPANISILEILNFEVGANDSIAAGKLPELDKILSAEFPSSRIIGVPVLFDESDDLSFRRTSAFTPDLVNLQILGSVLLMPRPYGPRVPLALAADVLASVLPSATRARANASVLSGKKLDVTVHWARATNNKMLAEQFRDGFPTVKNTDDVAKAIAAANRGHFQPDGELRPGWRRLIIPERTVDIFQAYTELVMEPLGVSIHWIDSWYYHIAYGGIHCGTNVLRRPPATTKPWWKS